MKSHTPIIVATLAVLAGLAATFVAARQFQPPQAALAPQIDERVHEAAAMLAAYDPRDARLAGPAEIADTQPAEPDDPAHLDELKQRSELISAALERVNEAVGLREESGDEVVSGDTHQAATQLQATLYIAQADVLRREAGVHRARAEAARRSFADLASRWREVDTLARSQARDIGGEAPAAMPRPATETADDAAPAPKAAPVPAGPRRPGALARLLARSLGRAEPDAAPQPQPDQPTDQAEAQPAQPAFTGPSEIVFEKMPTIPERITALRQQREQVAAGIAAAQPDMERLQAAIAELEQQLTAARAKAEEAQQRMLAMEQAGIDASDPQSLPRFTQEYEEASRLFRENSREASILEHGGIRNARPASDDENEVLTAQLAPAERGAEMTPIRGLVPLQKDFSAAKSLIETRQALLKQIDEQIARLETRQNEVAQRVSKLDELRKSVAQQVAASARLAVAEAMEANRLETEALELITGPGMTAAERASRAAGQANNNLRTFYQTHLPQGQAPQLNFISGHAQTLQGDAQYQAALVQGQRARDLASHARMLETARQIGIDAKALLPEGAEEPPAWATAAEAASTAAGQNRDEAVKAAEAALDVYKGAETQLDKFWMLHTQMGAVHHFLALLAPTPADAQRHRDEARRRYELATRDRADLPEAQPYRRIMEGLSAGAPQ